LYSVCICNYNLTRRSN